MIRHRPAPSRHKREAKQALKPPSYTYHQLEDGRWVPIESGGLVELALAELGARLVDATNDQVLAKAPGLN